MHLVAKDQREGSKEIETLLKHFLLRTTLAGPPENVISTPACIQTCLSNGVIQAKVVQDSLSVLILDEADLLLSYGYEDDLKALTSYVPRGCQCLLMSATSSSDVEKLKKLILHNPYILTLPEVGDTKDDVIPKNVQQFYEFNAGLFDYLIATDESQPEGKEQVDDQNGGGQKKLKKHRKNKLDAEFGVVRGIDFKMCILFLLKREIFEEIKSLLGEYEDKVSHPIAPFPLLSKNAVKSLRYRAEDVQRSVTTIRVKEARAQDLRNEIINSKKLMAYFQDNPQDLDLLNHDKMLSKKAPAQHLRDMPDYLVGKPTQEAGKFVKLCAAAMGNTNASHGKGSKGSFKRNRDPLKTFSAEASK